MSTAKVQKIIDDNGVGTYTAVGYSAEANPPQLSFQSRAVLIAATRKARYGVWTQNSKFWN